MQQCNECNGLKRLSNLHVYIYLDVIIPTNSQMKLLQRFTYIKVIFASNTSAKVRSRELNQLLFFTDS